MPDSDSPDPSPTAAAPPASSGRSRARAVLLIVLAALLTLAASWYLTKGFRELTVSMSRRADFGAPLDLHFRWVEFRYIFWNGQNPFDVYFAVEPEGPVVPPHAIDRPSEVDPALGPVERASYPPWAYVTGAPLWIAPWPAVRWLAAGFNAISLLVLALWGWRYGRSLGIPAAMVLASATLACAHHYSILDIGQVTLYVVALLVGGWWAARARLDTLAGLLLGLAMLKPTIAGPFFLVLLVTWRWRAMASCLAYLAVASVVVWVRTGASPVEMLQQMAAIAEQVEMGKGAPGPITWLASTGLDAGIAAKVIAVGLLGPGLVAMWLLRRQAIIVLFACAAVIAHLWTHHKPYDEIIVLFLVVPLAYLALRPSARWWLVGLASVTAISLLKLNLLDPLGTQGLAVVQAIVWPIGLVVLARRSADLPTIVPQPYAEGASAEPVTG